jgi:demethylspheroidene O-methyltransferase
MDAWMASPSVYRWSIEYAFTRWFTQRKTRKVFELMAGFVHSQVLLSCVRLGILSRLQKEPATLAELAHLTQLPEERLERLVLSAVAIGLIDKRGNKRAPGFDDQSKALYALGSLGLPVVSYPGIAAMVEHNAVLYADLSDPKVLLEGHQRPLMSQYWPYTIKGDHAEDQMPSADTAHKYSDLMSASQNFVLEELFYTYPFEQHRVMLDIGCGLGRFAVEAALRYADLSFKLMDLPPVLGLTRERLVTNSNYARFQFYPGSFKTDPLPRGADLITLVRVAHDHADDDVQKLFVSAFEALPQNGVILIAEPMASHSRAMEDAYFHFYLLAMGEGRLRTPDQLCTMLAQAGFTQIECLDNPMPMHTRILRAVKS